MSYFAKVVMELGKLLSTWLERRRRGNSESLKMWSKRMFWALFNNGGVLCTVTVPAKPVLFYLCRGRVKIDEISCKSEWE